MWFTGAGIGCFLGRRDKAGMLDKWDWGGLDRRMQGRVGRRVGRIIIDPWVIG